MTVDLKFVFLKVHAKCSSRPVMLFFGSAAFTSGCFMSF